MDEESLEEIVQYRQEVLESGLYPEKFVISDVLYDDLTSSDSVFEVDYGKMEAGFLDFLIIGKSDLEDGYELIEAVCANCHNDELLKSEGQRYCPICELQ